MKPRSKKPINPKKILSSARFSPRYGFQDELLGKLKKVEVHPSSLKISNLEKPLASRKIPRYKKALFALTISGVILFLIACTPTIIAAIFSWFPGLSLITVDTEKFDTTAVSQNLIEEFPGKRITYGEAQKLVPFEILLPFYLPEELILEGFFVTELDGDDPGHRVAYVYLSSEKPNGSLMIIQFTGKEVAGTLVSEDAVRKMTIHNYDAYYVLGTWEITGAGDLVWDENIDSVMLFWGDDLFSYSITADQLEFSIMELIRIMESIMKEEK